MHTSLVLTRNISISGGAARILAPYNTRLRSSIRRQACWRSNRMSEEQEIRKELDERARKGETVVPGGTGGKSLEAQEHLAEGRSRGGQTRKEQIETEGYKEMGRKGGLSSTDKSGEERAAEEGIEIDESKYKTGS